MTLWESLSPLGRAAIIIIGLFPVWLAFAAALLEWYIWWDRR